ncbi:polyprenol monophosphomannose synthase [Phytomonospora sp. NPDC050363]|uniref:polyprenol monophosphomannose synthase n=1 Tax=Phytomonospora sp. NPDC050363 TaxID=3155642 RepID=UPI0033D9A63B
MDTAHTPEAIALPSPWSDSSVAIVVPTYNERDNMRELLDRVAALPLTNLRVIIVDDGSPDGTADEAELIGKEFTESRPDFVTVLRRTTKDGLGRAYIAGFGLALSTDADYIVQMDADLSHPPEYIPALLGGLLSTGASMVIGSRYVSGGSLADEWKLHRRFLSGWANVYVNTILGLHIRDATAGFKIWTREALVAAELDNLHSQGYSFQVEMNYVTKLAGGKIVEIPIRFHERSAGVSKMSLNVKIESAKLPFRLRFGGRRKRA